MATLVRFVLYFDTSPKSGPVFFFQRFLVQLVLLFLSPVGASKKNHDHQGATKIDTAINGPLLLNELLLDYDSFARPSSHNGGPCQVQVNLSPSYVAWKEDQLKATVTLEQTWMDERLKFAVCIYTLL